MTNPPDKPRDDRRMHEGEKKGLGGSVNHAKQGEVRSDRDEIESTDGLETSRYQNNPFGYKPSTSRTWSAPERRSL